MTTETLHCTMGDHNWEREIVRGRKPKDCPECKSGKSKKSTKKKPAKPEVLKQAEKKYKQRTQMRGQYFDTIGEPEVKTLASGRKLEIYEGFELTDGTVMKGTLLREKGMSSRYRFVRLIVREDGTAYADLIGASGVYGGKYRSIGIQDLTL